MTNSDCGGRINIENVRTPRHHHHNIRELSSSPRNTNICYSMVGQFRGSPAGLPPMTHGLSGSSMAQHTPQFLSDPSPQVNQCIPSSDCLPGVITTRVPNVCCSQQNVDGLPRIHGSIDIRTILVPNSTSSSSSLPPSLPNSL
jgi:hypothetical protein